MAQLRHVNAQILALFRVSGTPNFLEQLAMRDHFAGIADERREELARILASGGPLSDVILAERDGR